MRERKQKYLNVFPFEGLMAEVFVTNGVECWKMASTETGEGGGRGVGSVGGVGVRIWRTDVYRQRTQSGSAVFTLVISNLAGICLTARTLKELVYYQH